VVASARAWLPAGAWDAREDKQRYPGGPPDRAKVVLSFDGSKTGDSTALRGWTVEDVPHGFTVGIWERPAGVAEWRVPRAEVKDAIRAACRRWYVREVAWDDFMWQDAREELEDEGVPIEVYPQTAERMGKATQRFYEAVVAWLGSSHTTATRPQRGISRTRRSSRPHGVWRASSRSRATPSSGSTPQ